ncbi:MAG: hypothetical protein SFV51_30120 [Bryobacteraceae bacterium]|nr:hypothetical protein [Bryobacteraceae bacterium]
MSSSHKAIVDQSSVEVRWVSPAVVAEVPLPGTRRFADLVGALEPFGPDASRIWAEAPSARLSDIEIRFGLRGGDILLAFSYAGFRILISPFETLYEKDLGRLADCALRQIGSGGLLPPQGRFFLSYGVHLRLDGITAADYLRTIVGGLPEVEPDGFSGKLSPAPPMAASASIRCEKSQNVPGGLFVGCTLEYDGVPELDSLTGRGLEAAGYVIALLGVRF